MHTYCMDTTYSYLPILVEAEEDIHETVLRQEIGTWVRFHHGSWNGITAVAEGTAEDYTEHLSVSRDGHGGLIVERM